MAILPAEKGTPLILDVGEVSNVKSVRIVDEELFEYEND